MSVPFIVFKFPLVELKKPGKSKMFGGGAVRRGS
jgi:hypothetical protein